MTTAANEAAPVRSGEELDAQALSSYLREQLPDIPGDQVEISQFPGGHSNLTYLVRVGDREYVLRRPPFGPVAPTAHDMPREYRLLKAIHPCFHLAPEPFLLCEDTTVIGAPFYLMERRHGIVVRRDLPDEIGDNHGLRRRIGESVVDTLVSLHAVDIEKNGLSGIGKPAGFVERQVTGWAKRWERSKTTDLREFDETAAWLIAHLPPDPSTPTLVHNDFKLDNMILDRRDPARIVAILDWEMCTVGDPLVDLGLLLCYWPQKDDPEPRLDAISGVTALPGFISRNDIIERYARGSRRDLSCIAFYETFALFKLAVVLQQIFYRYHVGQTHDDRFADFDKRVAGLVTTARALIDA